MGHWPQFEIDGLQRAEGVLDALRLLWARTVAWVVSPRAYHVGASPKRPTCRRRGGGPNTNEAIFMALLPYYPFAP